MSRRPITSLTNSNQSSSWKLRVALLVVLSVFWAGFTALMRRDRSPSIDEQAAAIIESSEPQWRVENLYLAAPERNLDSQNRTYALPAAKEPTLRVLVLGDSFTFGSGLTDRGTAWPAQLELLLRAKGLDVGVTSYAYPGASFFTYYDWLTRLSECETGSGCDDVMKAAAGADVVVIGFYANDTHPAPGDSIVAETGLSAQPQLPQLEPSPFEEYIPAYAARITELVGAPVYWMPLAGIGSHTQNSNWDPERWWSMVSGGGFSRIGFDNALAATERHRAEDLMINPADYHPSSILHRAYALDAAAGLEDTLERMLQTRDAAAGQPASGLLATSLIYDALPRVDVRPDQEALSITYVPNPRWLCRTYTGDSSKLRTALSRSGLPVDTVTCNGDDRAVVRLTSGPSITVPYQPCAALGRPYVELFLNPNVVSTAPLIVTSRSDLLVRPVTYDADGKRIIGSPLRVRDGASIRSTGVRSLIVHGTGEPGCGEDRDPVTEFSINVSH